MSSATGSLSTDSDATIRSLSQGMLQSLNPLVASFEQDGFAVFRDVFTPQMTAASSLDETPEAWSLSCCSCTPCCCAASVTQPMRKVA